jgi:tetratricopeptide (TPR) repeat protein
LHFEDESFVNLGAVKLLLSIAFLLIASLGLAQEPKADSLARRTQNTSDPLEQSIENDSSMLYPYLERAQLRVEGGYYKGALADYNSAIVINDKDAGVWLKRGMVKEKLNDLKGAHADYSKAIELKETYLQAWFNRANVLAKLARYKEAVDDYTVAIAKSPDYAAAFYGRALAYDKMKRATEACDDLKKAESLGFFIEEKMKSKLCAS